MEPEIQTREADQEEKLDFKRILPIFVIVLIDLMGLTIIIPLAAALCRLFWCQSGLNRRLGRYLSHDAVHRSANFRPPFGSIRP